MYALAQLSIDAFSALDDLRFPMSLAAYSRNMHHFIDSFYLMTLLSHGHCVYWHYLLGQGQLLQ